MSFFDVFPTFYESPYSYTLVPLIVVSSIVGFYRKDYFHALLLHPYEVWQGKRLYTLLTSAFVHRSWLHLLFNCFFIYAFLYDTYGNIEQESGVMYARITTPILALVMIVLPNLLQTWVQHKNFFFTTVGASGLFFGLFGFSFLYFPLQPANNIFISSISNSIHLYVLGFVVFFLLSRLKRVSINRFLHLYAYIVGGALALILRPTSIHEIIIYCSRLLP